MALKRSDNNKRYYPCSFLQKRLWALQQSVPQDPVYNVALGLRLFTNLSFEKIQTSLASLFRVHEVFRTSFVEQKGDIFQVVSEQWLPDIDTQIFDCEIILRDEKAEKLLRESTSIPFNLSKPPVRAKIVQFDDDDWLLFIIVHHLIIDQTSIQVLLQDLEQILTTGLPALSTDGRDKYSTYALWEHDFLQSEKYQRDFRFWQDYLEDAPSHVEIQTDNPRANQQTFDGDIVRLNVSESIYKHLKKRIRKLRATTGIYIASIWILELYLRTRVTDIVIGSGISNRPEEGFNKTVGCFMNTLPIRVKINPAWTFAELLDCVKKAMLDAYEHRFVPYGDLVTLSKEPSLIGPTFANIYYDFHSEGMSTKVDVSDVMKSEPIQIFNRRSKCDLTLNVTATPDKLNGLIEYNTNLFNASSVERMAAEISTLLEQSLDNINVPISNLNMKYSSLSGALPKECDGNGYLPSVIDDFVNQASRSPHREAIREGDRSLTYGELDRLSNQLAYFLKGRSIGLNDVVGLCIPRSIESVVAVVGIWKAGAAYVPLDPSYGKKRLLFMLHDAKPGLVLGHPNSQTLIDWERPFQNIFEVFELAPPVHSPLPALRKEDTAYIIYTSGSTGEPKGVVVSHQTIWYRLKYEFLPISDDEVICHRSSLNFVDSIWEIFAPLTRGSRLVIASNALTTEPKKLFETLAREQVSCIVVVPALLDLLLESDDDIGDILPALKLWICGGDEISESLRNKFFEKLPGRRLINSYGTSETWDISWYETKSTDTGPTPVGHIIPNVQVKILDDEGLPVPVGTQGSLYIGGKLLSKGYFENPEQTALAFVSDPTGGAEKIYCTGDRAWLDSKGLLFLAGRNNRQVKINGYRVELGEIEERLLQYKDVLYAVVICVKKNGSNYLVAFVQPRVVSQSPGELTAKIHRHLSDYLPPFSLPGVINVVSEIPLTPNGKVDKVLLKGMAQRPAAVLPQAARQARIDSETEMQITQVLDVSGIDFDVSFIENGGNSITAILLISKLRKKNIELTLPQLLSRTSLKEVLEGASSRGLPTYPSSARDEYEAKDQQYITGSNDETSFHQFAATPMQTALVCETLARPEDAKNIFNISMYLNQPLSEARLAEAFRQVVSRHPGLRSSFVFQENRLWQRVFSETQIRLNLNTDKRGSVEDYVSSMSDSVKTGLPSSLVWLNICNGQKDTSEIQMLAHHAIFDAWSLGLFFKDLIKAYDSGLALDSGRLLTDIKQYAKRVNAMDESVDAKQPWRDVFHDWRPYTFSCVRTAPHSSKTSYVDKVIPAAHVNCLDDLCRQENVQLRELFLAIHCASISSWFAQKDVATGVVVNTRGYLNSAAESIGMFVNIVPYRIAVDGTWSELIERVSEFENRLSQAFLCSTQQILAALDNKFGMEILFNFVNTVDILPQSALEGVSFFNKKTSVNTTTPLLVTVSLSKNGECTVTLESNNELIGSEELEYFLDLYGSYLDSLVAGGLQTAVALPASNLPKLLPLDFKPQGCIHDLIEHQAEKCGHAIAVKDSRTQITYQELLVKARSIAGYLQRIGVKPNTLVGVYMDKSVDLICALVGVLMSGGAYLPLDKRQGIKRIDRIVNEAKPVVIIGNKPTEAEAIAKEQTWLGLQDLLLQAQNNNYQAFDRHSSPDAMAYVIYTSGSTGFPKGVMVSHGSVVNRLLWMIDEFNTGAEDIILQKTALTFDVSVWECFMPLMCGASIMCSDSHRNFDPDYLTQMMIQEKITVVHFVPQLLEEFLKHPNAKVALQSVKSVVCSGDVLSSELAQTFFDLVQGCELYNLYGPTEAAIDVTFHKIPKTLDNRAVPIGKPIWNNQLVVLDKCLNQVPLGAQGELYIVGAGLGIGYLNRPDLTAQRFLPNPFADTGSRMYKTGDHGRILKDGNVYYLGRVDNEIKVNGVRINLAEIENALCSYDGIASAIVQFDKPQVAAYLVKKPNANIMLAQLREHLATELPPEAIPARFGLIPELPRNSSGKADKKAVDALSNVVWLSGSAHPEKQAVTNEEQATLIKLWERVLKVPEISPQDNFYVVGGNSISAVIITHEANKLGFTFSVADLLQKVTIEALLDDVVHVQDQATLNSEPAEDVRDNSILSEEEGDVTAIQQHMLESYQKCGSGPLYYHLQYAYKIALPALCINTLAQSIKENISKHPVLYSVFNKSNGKWRQSTNLDSDISVNIEHLKGIADQQAFIEQFMKKDKEHRFVVENGPLLRLYLFAGLENEVWLVMSTHHAIYDGWSHRMLIEDIFNSYRSRIVVKPRSEGDKAVGHVDTSFQTLPYLEKDSAQCNKAKAHFGALERLSKPRALSCVDTERLMEYQSELSSKLLFSLIKKAKEQRVSLKSLLAFALFKVVREELGIEGIGVITNGRSPKLPDPFHSVGMFWNILPLFAKNDENVSLEEVHNGLYENDIYANYPIDNICHWKSFTQCVFRFLNFPAFEFRREGFNPKIEKSIYYDKYDFPCVFSTILSDGDTEASIRVEFNAGFISERKVEKIVAMFFRNLTGIVDE